MALLPGAMCGIMLHVSIREERRKEVAMLKQLELDSLIPNLSDLCIPALMQARPIFVAVSIWMAILLGISHFVIQSNYLKMLLVFAAWALVPVGARAATKGNLRSIQFSCALGVWKMFYAAFMFPRIFKFAIALINAIVNTA
jgi:hypothetical protein